METKDVNDLIISSFKKKQGIVDACPLLPDDRERLGAIEKDAEERSLMGLGKVLNTGVIEVLDCEMIYVGLTDMNFDWGCHPTLILKKGDVIVGEEVRDEETIARLSQQKDVWFMHRNFVVYKDKISFPHDITKKICHFEIPPLPVDWIAVKNDELQYSSIIFANPATPADIYLKEQYFGGLDERGLGTILIGINTVGKERE